MKEPCFHVLINGRCTKCGDSMLSRKPVKLVIKPPVTTKQPPQFSEAGMRAAFEINWFARGLGFIPEIGSDEWHRATDIYLGQFTPLESTKELPAVEPIPVKEVVEEPKPKARQQERSPNPFGGFSFALLSLFVAIECWIVVFELHMWGLSAIGIMLSILAYEFNYMFWTGGRRGPIKTWLHKHL